MARVFLSKQWVNRRAGGWKPAFVMAFAKAKAPVCGLIPAVLGAFLVATGSPAIAQTLDEELLRLIKEHPRLQVAKKEQAVSDERISQARSVFLPSLQLLGDIGREYTNSPLTRGTADRTLNATRENAQVTLTQNLFDGFRSTSGLEIAKVERESADVSLNAEQQELLFQGASAYLNVLRGSELVQLAKFNEEIIKEQLDLEDERVERGAGIAVDVLLAKSRLQLAKERRVALEGRLFAALDTYRQVFGRSISLATMKEPNLATGLLPATRDAAITGAMQNNLQLATAKKLIEVADKKRTQQRSGFYPRVDLVAEAGYEEDLAGVESYRRDAAILLRVTWDLFSGGRTLAESREAAIQYGIALDNRNDVQRKVIELVETAWDDYRTMAQRETLLENAVNIATEVFIARSKLRDSGKETALNVLDAQSEVFNARINLVSAKFDKMVAEYQILAATGGLDPQTLGLAP